MDHEALDAQWPRHLSSLKKALYYPARRGATALDGGAAVDGKDGCGATALYAACMTGHADCAEFLFERGASVRVAQAHGACRPAGRGLLARRRPARRRCPAAPAAAGK